MRLHIAARKTHKWLGLFIGLQVVIWSLSGVYMTVVHIDMIHGDHLIRPAEPAAVDVGALADPLGIAAAHKAEAVRLAWMRGQPIYVVRNHAGEQAVDARSGRVVAPPSEQEIRAIASATYTGSERSRRLN